MHHHAWLLPSSKVWRGNSLILAGFSHLFETTRPSCTWPFVLKAG
jgi:hypothetical protein